MYKQHNLGQVVYLDQKYYIMVQGLEILIYLGGKEKKLELLLKHEEDSWLIDGPQLAWQAIVRYYLLHFL